MAGGDLALGPADEAGDADSAFEGGQFSFAEGCGESGVVAVAEEWAVVAGEDHDRSIGDAAEVDRIEDIANGGIEFGDHVAVGAMARSAAKGFAGEDRDVGHDVREVEEEGLVRSAADEVDRFVSESTCEERLVGIGFDHAVAIVEGERRHLIGEGRVVLRVVVRVGDPEEFVEAVPQGAEVGREAEVPFAEDRGGVAVRLEDFWQEFFVGMDTDRAGVVQRPFHADAIGVATRHQGGA